MHARRAALWTVLLTGAVWLPVGPGREAVQALLTCHHHVAAHAGTDHDVPTPPTSPTPPTPGNAPCFCGQMTGGTDQAVSVALAEPEPSPPTWLVAVTDVSLPPLARPMPAPPATPPSPPPNPLG